MSGHFDWLYIGSWLAVFTGACICFVGVVLLIAWLT